MSETRSVTVTLSVETWSLRADLRLMAAALRYVATAYSITLGNGSTWAEIERATSDDHTDVRDTYFMARDAVEAMNS